MENYKSRDITLDDIVFEGRNKAYGAYWLRKTYSDYVLRALLIGGAAFSIATATPLILSQIQGEEEVEDVVVNMTAIEPPPPINPNEPPPPPPPPAPPPPKVSTVKFVPPEPVPDEEVVEPDPPKQEEMKEVQIATETIVGDPNADADIIIDENPGTGTALGAPPAEEQIFVAVEQMPEFPGGQAELFKFLSKNIRYPSQARNNNVQGTVFVAFVVGPDGKIRDAQVQKGIGYGCDEEALRVINTMPPWKPGKQSGRSVSVRYSVPIKFSLAQQ